MKTIGISIISVFAIIALIALYEVNPFMYYISIGFVGTPILLHILCELFWDMSLKESIKYLWDKVGTEINDYLTDEDEDITIA